MFLLGSPRYPSKIQGKLELDSKTLSVKTSHILVTGHGQIS